MCISVLSALLHPSDCVLQNALGCLERGKEVPRLFVDWTGGLCGTWNGEAVRAFVVNVPQYRIVEGGSRVGAMPLIQALKTSSHPPLPRLQLHWKTKQLRRQNWRLVTKPEKQLNAPGMGYAWQMSFPDLQA